MIKNLNNRLGASVFLKSVDFKAFAVNVKTIDSTQEIFVSIWTRNIVRYYRDETVETTNQH